MSSTIEMASAHHLLMRVAGLTVAFPCRSPYTRALCADYLCPDGGEAAGGADVVLTLSDEALAAERTKYEADYPDRPRPHDGYVEALALQRALAEQAVTRGRFLIHSAAIAVDGEAYAFLAPSGVGKSTHLAQWMARFGDRAVVLNGDKPFYSLADDRLMVHGSPWRGKENWGIPGSAPVRALCILERGQENRIYRLSPGDAVPGLLRQFYLPADPASAALCLATADRILRRVPVYHLQCTPTPEAAEVAYNEMSTSRGENP